MSITVDLANLPPLTEEQKAKRAALAAMPDASIDYSDAPQLPDSAWDNAVRGKFHRPTKTSTTVRIDSDVPAWLRSQGRGYQTRINAILRREMLAASKERRRAHHAASRASGARASPKNRVGTGKPQAVPSKTFTSSSHGRRYRPASRSLAA